ncbi:indole-3-glycerol phosphate synthase, chloroplastic-like [Phoenix dactylifera]|uniref:indole-3-glycerol-phosphate synthase n=1 Tax=Phoenix dactylifera TaxID=42345 RepID=A0A8B7D1F8_PHODC|nr:indole-3-glycerol phosphate synthase, chloroplastic-like [Phoenix dactylifera]
MEGIFAGASAKVGIPVPSFSVMRCRGDFPSMDRLPTILVGGARKPTRLRCMKADKEIKDGDVMITFKHDDLVNSVEVREWESGKSLNEIAAKQGIRIRRRYRTGHPSESSQDDEEPPRNILEKIIWDKEVEVSQLKWRIPSDALKEAIDSAPPVRDFVGALKASYQRTGLPALIAEVKKASPSRGVLREDFDPVQIAKAYEENGAACLSILTDEKYFQGGFENLEAVRRAGVMCPLLCKEFVIDSWQIYYARSKGADAILLIAAVLPDLDIKCMIKLCKELGLAALVEVHDERELDRVLSIDGIQLIGINNRNLETFEVDISNTKRLLEGERGEIIRQRGITMVGESGLFTPEDISYVQDSGVRAVLVGESLIKQSDPGKAIAGLFGRDVSI